MKAENESLRSQAIRPSQVAGKNKARNPKPRVDNAVELLIYKRSQPILQVGVPLPPGGYGKKRFSPHAPAGRKILQEPLWVSESVCGGSVRRADNMIPTEAILLCLLCGAYESDILAMISIARLLAIRHEGGVVRFSFTIAKPLKNDPKSSGAEEDKWNVSYEVRAWSTDVLPPAILDNHLVVAPPRQGKRKNDNSTADLPKLPEENVAWLTASDPWKAAVGTHDSLTSRTLRGVLGYEPARRGIQGLTLSPIFWGACLAGQLDVAERIWQVQQEFGFSTDHLLEGRNTVLDSSPLALAVVTCQPTVVRYLCETKKDFTLNKSCGSIAATLGLSPIRPAVFTLLRAKRPIEDILDTAEELLNYHPDLTGLIPAICEPSPFRSAGGKELLEFLMAKGKLEPSFEDLQAIAQQKNRDCSLDMLQLLFSIPETREMINQEDEDDGSTLLHTVRRSGNGVMEAFLLELGADVSIVDNQGRKPGEVPPPYEDDGKDWYDPVIPHYAFR